MNKKGQTIGLIIISLVFIVVIGLMSTNFLMDEVTNARTNLTCSNADAISDGTKLLCLVIDVTIIYWILGIFGIIAASVAGRML